MDCVRCNRQIEAERILALGTTHWCSVCARTLNTPRVVGYMEWSHKTAPVLRLTNRESFVQFKKDTDRRGQSSILRSKMTAGGRLV